MTRLFDIADVNKSASAFDVEKLTWLNQQHMMRVPPARIVPLLSWQLEREGIRTADEAKLEQIVVLQRERSKTVREMALNSVFFFRPPDTFDAKAVRKHVTADVLPILAEVGDKLEQLGDWSAPAIHALISSLAAAKGISLGVLAQPLRLAMCGGTVSPPIDGTLAVLGKAEVLSRLSRARAAWGA
jgi:glutamyl-tRNA synthetase